MINLTDSAVNAVKTAISSAAQPASGLRIMVETGGCAGFKYMMGLAEEFGALSTESATLVDQVRNLLGSRDE